MVDFTKMKALIDKAAAEGPNMNEAQAGGNYSPPSAGLVRLRDVGYNELGRHMEEFKGEKKLREKVMLIFEASGPKHPPLENGEPIRFTITESHGKSLSEPLNEKANLYKLFKRMNYGGTATHMAQLLGQDFLGTVIHTTKGEGDQKRTFASLKDDGGYTIRPPFVDDPETGESKRIVVDPPKGSLRCFLWNYADKEMWDSIFIDGQYEERKNDKGEVTQAARSKNRWQEIIKKADNFIGSPMADVLLAGGAADLPEPEAPARTEANVNAAADAAAGVVAEDPLACVA